MRRYNWKDQDIPYYWDKKLPSLILGEIEGNKILDVGCGNGYLVSLLVQRGYDAYGIDQDEHGIEIADQHTNKKRFYLCDIDKEDIPSEIRYEYDTIISTEVIEHLFSPDCLVEFCNRYLKNGGVLIISTPYHGYLKNLIISLLNKWDSHHASLSEGGHIKFFSKYTLTNILERNGFSVNKIIGVGRLPYIWGTMVAIAQKESD